MADKCPAERGMPCWYIRKPNRKAHLLHMHYRAQRIYVHTHMPIVHPASNWLFQGITDDVTCQVCRTMWLTPRQVSTCAYWEAFLHCIGELFSSLSVKQRSLKEHVYGKDEEVPEGSHIDTIDKLLWTDNNPEGLLMLNDVAEEAGFDRMRLDIFRSLIGMAPISDLQPHIAAITPRAFDVCFFYYDPHNWVGR